MTRLKRIPTGLLLLSLTLFGTACSVPVKSLPPDTLLQDCEHAAEPAERTQGALAGYAIAERQALDLCNTDKKALREWKSAQ